MKKEIDKILKQVINVFLLSSGHLYLFKSLRKLNSIQNLANKYSAFKLMNFYSKASKKKEIDKMCLFYLILVALSFKTYTEANKYIKDLRKKEYMWSNEMIEMVESSFKSIIIEPFNIEKKTIIIPHTDMDNNLFKDSTTN